VSFKGVKELGPFVDPLLTVDAGVVGVAGEELRVAAVERDDVEPLLIAPEYAPNPNPRPMVP
jgi:hypothetical protein